MQGIIVEAMELVKPKDSGFDLEDVRTLVRDDWSGVDEAILANLQSDVALVNSVSRYIVNSGGKRFRPLLVLLAAPRLWLRG